MSSPSAREPIRLNPLEQWEYFSQPRAMHDRLRARYGEVVPLTFQGRKYAAILSAAAAQEVFAADPANYDAFWKESFSGLNGEDSLWVLIGERHRRERRLYAPAVHAHYFRPHGSVVRDITRHHIDKWRPGQTVRAIETTLAITLDIIMRLVFGVEDEALMEQGRVILEELRRSVHPLIVFYPKLQRPWFPLWRRYVAARADMFAWADRVIALRRARREAGDDVLGRLMTASDEQGRPYTDEHIRNELGSVLGAGHETTATALAWALHELGLHPEVMTKLRAELEPAAGAHPVDALPELPYLAAVCNEAIRLHPILAECARVPMVPLEIRGHPIEPGQALVISIVGIHHDPITYPHPDRYVPERFVDRRYGKYEFLPFGGGHRRCLGAPLADYSMRIVLAEIALNWEFETAEVDRDVRHDIAMGPKHGVPLRVRARRRGMHVAEPRSGVASAQPFTAPPASCPAHARVQADST
ncbi:MAG TPA: cytochrome P450 [Polyangiaceae bacterium]|nr:cytochrome P450 [Polyangiaceae bacterium]